MVVILLSIIAILLFIIVIFLFLNKNGDNKKEKVSTTKEDTKETISVSNVPLDFEKDFNKNIVPLIVIHMEDFISNKFRPHIHSEYYKFTTADAYWKKNNEEYIKTLLESIPETLMNYFKRYMDEDTFLLKIAQVAKDITIEEMAKELALYNEEKNIPIENIEV